MDDSHQLEVPASFLRLYSTPSGHRLTEPMAVVRERYELCEDLAQMLSEQARAKLFELGVAESDVLGKMALALAAEGSPVRPAEAWWVVRRLAEVLGWPDPGEGPAEAA